MSKPDSSDRLSFTLFLAIAVHAVIIFGVTFSLHKSDKIAPTLNITLATHASKKAPEKADFLAQHNQEASGTETELKEMSTTELAKVADVNINQVNPVPVQAAKVVSERELELLKTEAESRKKVAANDTVTDTDNAQDGQQDATNAVARSQKLASLQAKLDQQRQAFAREPRITRHTSVSTKSSDEAAYYNQWSQKIIRVGNKNFPKEAIDNDVYGSLRLEVGIHTDGRVAHIYITQSSGHTILDDAARRIVRLAEPYDPLPPEITKTTDIFVIFRTWNFEITGLTTSD